MDNGAVKKKRGPSGELETFSAVLSPLSWMVIIPVFVIGWLVLNRLSIGNSLAVLGVDQLTGILNNFAFKPLVRRKFPASNLFFEKLDLEKIQHLPRSELPSLVRDLRRFPKWSSDLVVKMNFLKGAPPLFLTLYLAHSDQPMFWGAILFLLLFTMAISMRALQVVESHSLASRILARIHEQVDLSDIFAQTEPLDFQDEFRRVEGWSFVMITLSLICQVVLLTLAGHNDSRLPFQIAIAVGASMIFMGRLFWTSRRHFIQGFNPIFSVMRDYNPLEKIPKTLSLHTTSVHARTEEIVNSLFSRIRGYEEELVQQVFEKTEEQRYKSLGEMSALVVHDLASPLQAIQFIRDKVTEDPEIFAKRTHYSQQLSSSVDRMSELLHSLRSYLKNQQRGGTYITYLEAHQHTLKLLATRFVGTGIDAVKFEIDAQLETLSPSVSQPDLIHVLMNIYGNAVENMISNAVPSPTLRVRLRSPGEQTFTVEVCDNGTGLDKERFEILTGDAPRSRGGSPRDGLGLRLVRRLLKAIGGDIQIDPDRSGPGLGTTLLLIFPRRSGERSNELAS